MIGSIAAAKHPPRLIYNLRRDSYELLNTQIDSPRQFAPSKVLFELVSCLRYDGQSNRTPPSSLSVSISSFWNSTTGHAFRPLASSFEGRKCKMVLSNTLHRALLNRYRIKPQGGS